MTFYSYKSSHAFHREITSIVMIIVVNQGESRVIFLGGEVGCIKFSSFFKKDMAQ